MLRSSRAPRDRALGLDQLFGDLLNAPEMSEATLATMFLHDLRIAQVNHFTAVPALF
jgi:hypothetical protein